MVFLYNANIFRNRYIIIDEKTGKIIWRPILDFEKNMNYEATKVFGASRDGTLFCYPATNLFAYAEAFQVKFSCPFNFETFPFDSHECCLTYGDLG